MDELNVVFNQKFQEIVIINMFYIFLLVEIHHDQVQN